MTGERESANPVAAVVLAAGGSTRMGTTKQLLPVGGQPMVRRVTAAACAAGLAQVIVVIGAQAGAVRRALTDLQVDIVVNEGWQEGMSTSIHAGIHALRPDIQALLVLLGDQPAVTTAVIQAVVHRHQTTASPIVVPVYRGRRGNPVLFHRSLFADLLAVEGDQGGRALIARHADLVDRLDLKDVAVITDVDTPRDYEKVRTPENT
jgi:molybdenum cofactor cytidylyltransferase